VSRFSALEVDATPYRGNAPLMVDFTQENRGIDGPLERDFGNGTVHIERETSHIFTDAGLYMVQASVPS
jgi:PKD repeat protein